MFPFEKKANPLRDTARNLSATGVRVIVTQGVVVHDVLLGLFKESGRFQHVGIYRATISWGDDTSPTTGIITPLNVWYEDASSIAEMPTWSNDSFCVSGSHIYATTGRFPIDVTIWDERGSSTTAHTNALIGSLNERFIAQAYLDLLHHTIDQHRLSHWSQLLDGSTTRTQIIQEMLNTLEYRKYLVESLYRLFLHQPANQKQLKQALHSLENDITFTQLKVHILNSPEYFQRRGHGTNEGFLAALYSDIMGRAITSDEALSWSRKLEEGDSRASIVKSVLTCLEAEMKVVGSYYEQFFPQTANNKVLSNALDVLRSGESLEKVIADILGSDDYLYSSVGTRLYLPPGGPRLIVFPILDVSDEFNNPSIDKKSPLWTGALVNSNTFLVNDQPEFEWVPILGPRPLVNLEFTWTNHFTKTPPYSETDVERVNRMFNESEYDSSWVRLVGLSGTAVISPSTI